MNRITRFRNAYIKTCNWCWYKWQKLKYRLPRIWSAIAGLFMYLLMALFGLGFVVCIIAMMMAARESIIKEGQIKRIEMPESPTAMVKCGEVDFRKCILEGHEYWFAGRFSQGGLVHSESCPCHSNKVEVVR